MANLLQASRVQVVNVGDGVDFSFFGILIPADAADTSLTITNLDGYPVSWTDGQLLGGVVYPIAGTAVTSAGSTTVTIFGA